jgi:hypothetical protein
MRNRDAIGITMVEGRPHTPDIQTLPKVQQWVSIYMEGNKMKLPCVCAK